MSARLVIFLCRLQICSQLMRHSKRKRLTSCDVNRALRLFDAQPIYGHEAIAAPASNAAYIAVPEAEVYVEDDHDCVDLAEVALGHSDFTINDGGGLSLQGKEGCTVVSFKHFYFKRPSHD